MREFTQLKKNLKKDFSGFKRIKIAVLGDTATQFLNQAIRGLGYESGLDLDIWEADFNQIERQVLDPTSELYDFKPQIVIVFLSAHKLLSKYNKLKPSYTNNLANAEIDSISNIYNSLQSGLNAKVIFYNYNEIDDTVYGNFANKTESSFLFQLRKLNYEMMLLATNYANLFICDLSSIQNHYGKLNFFHTSVYINTEMVLSIEVLPKIASRTIDLINAFEGQFKKCVILDLDNTTWGGIIGDDGIENIQIGSLGIGKAFSEFQYWIKKLKNRGIIVAVCSKNTESVAKDPFENHPDMVLRLADIAVFVANWDNKADNIRQIQQVLNIGFDSMVFLDDNPFERNIVRENIPQICVPELPEDPADYLEYLYALNLFETVSFSNEDSERTRLYQIEAERHSVQQKFTNEGEFLSSLNMLSLVESFNKFNTPRVSQLSQRSNQFNLRTIRYTDAEIENIGSLKEFYTFAFTLEDKFGDNGLICVIVLNKLSEEQVFVDTWFMSCRVLKRGMENFVLNYIVESAQSAGFKYLVGEYIPSAKNEMVKDHYLNLGFEAQGENWLLVLDTYQTRETYIKKK
jgi:FkbH-like protein